MPGCPEAERDDTRFRQPVKCALGKRGIMPKKNPTGFDLSKRSSHPRASRHPEPLPIRRGDVVRQRPNGLPLQVMAVEGDKVYCQGFIDPFGMSGLELLIYGRQQR